MEYGLNEDSLHELNQGVPVPEAPGKGRGCPEYLFLPLILPVEAVSDL
jgi:hypothetical protein